MNTLEQSLECDRENAMVDGTLITPSSQIAPAPSPTPVAQTGHWRFLVFIVLMSLAEIAAVVFLLRDVPADLLRREFEGLARVICVLACIGLFVWRVSRALAQDARQPGVSGHVETLPATWTLPPRGPKPPYLAIQSGMINPSN